jgi:tetratricopeptide (TPR) repeat protein
MYLRRSLVLIALVLFPTAGFADNDSWVGRQIMLKQPGVQIGHSGLIRGFLGRQVVVAELTDLVYPVLREQDGWLAVRHRGREDWFPKEKAILLDDALSYFSDRIRANDKDAFALAHRGRAWKERGELEKALADFNDAIRLDPEKPAYLSNRGVVYDRLGQYDRAIADYNEALRRDPLDAQTYDHRGLAYRSKNDDNQAIADYTQALRLDPRLAEAYYHRANTYKGQKQHESAIRDYGEAIRLNPNWADAYFNRARAHRANKEYDQAIRDYREVIRLDAKDADALGNLAWLLATCPDEKIRDGRQAVEYAMTACDLTSWKAAYFLATLAAACAENGQFDQAVKWQKRALETPKYEKEEGRHARRRLAMFEDRKPYRED